MFWAIKPESFRLSKRQHLADFLVRYKWHKKEGIGTIIERKEIKQVLGPSVRRTQTGTTGARVCRVRYDRSPATLPPEIADDGTVLSGPSYSPTIARSHTQGTKLKVSPWTKPFSAT